MMSVELFAPKGSLSTDQRRQVAELLGSPGEFARFQPRRTARRSASETGCSTSVAAPG
ncbi:hypothetical protein SAMN02982929_02461 [Saccharopolyspora kobensis]|uniref:Uncharacterized protein n=1 Tax=Saccharopolyspora kobensis TaxID=146035 RepID=A0A1H6ARA2_9PSEU|nr:hypothetical protein SAMN02982929_02461 [Saccharopolyspora kobensis]SFE77353.1 hypothetical protein SAMN05216506_11469 [Saccharopolyspora kobensis]